MHVHDKLRTRVAVASLLALTGVAQAAGIYQCTQADGSVTLSDVACPPDTLTREYRGEATAGGRSPSPSQDPWSVMNQVRRIEQREAAERKAAAATQRHGGKTGNTKALASERPRKLSYQEAHRKALEAAGYNADSQLSKVQREDLAEELAKYGYSLREPAKKSTTRKDKRKTPGADDSATAVPDPSRAADPGNASLTHHPGGGNRSAKKRE